MNTTTRIRLAALTISIAITAVLQGTLLWSFETVAQQASQQAAGLVAMSTCTSQNS
jgi:hypothetical protein